MSIGVASFIAQLKNMMPINRETPILIALALAILLLAWGFFFKKPDLIGLILTVVASFFLVITARVKENENIRYFGLAYLEYMKNTRRFIPYLFLIG